MGALSVLGGIKKIREKAHSRFPLAYVFTCHNPQRGHHCSSLQRLDPIELCSVSRTQSCPARTLVHLDRPVGILDAGETPIDDSTVEVWLDLPLVSTSHSKRR